MIGFYGKQLFFINRKRINPKSCELRKKFSLLLLGVDFDFGIKRFSLSISTSFINKFKISLYLKVENDSSLFLPHFNNS